MITFEKARIVGNVQVTGQTLQNKLRVATIINEKVADALGVKWMLFDSHGVIRAGAHDIGLDNDYNGARFSHEIPKLGKLLLEAVQATKFQVKRLGDGKKKPKKLMLAFSVIYNGANIELQEHLIRIGKGDGIVTIEAPEQLNLGVDGGTRVEMGWEIAMPVIKEYSGKGWMANVTVTAVADGFEVTRRANSPTKKLKQGPPGKFGSEQEALEEGLLDVKRWAEKIAAGGERKEKREAVKVIGWAQEMIEPAKLIEEVRLFDPSGEQVFAGTRKDLREAADTLREIVNPVQAAREYPD